MKTKKAELPVVIILVVVGVILVGLLVAWTTGVFKDKKQDLNSGTEKIDNVIGTVADFDLLAYDDQVIKGESLKDLIEEFKNKVIQVSIEVHTLDGGTANYNYSVSSSVSGGNTTENLGTSVTTTPTADKSAASYITPTGNFLGKVKKNINNEIYCLEFTQQK